MTIRFDLTHCFVRGSAAKKDLRALTPVLRSAQRLMQKQHRSGDLAFADLPPDRQLLRQVQAAARQNRNRYKNVIVLGMGGSALGFVALRDAFLHPFHNQMAEKLKLPAFYVLDNVDPELVDGVLDLIRPEQTLVNVITKSGSTVETVGQFLLFFERFAKKLGSRKKAIEHFVLTTDRERGPLRKLVEQEGFASLPVPDKVGGRFSVLSPVGLFPAALAGIKIGALLNGAAAAAETSLYGDVRQSPALLSAGLHYLHYQQGRRIAVMMPYANSLYRLADWFRQLWAESLGKAVNLDGKKVHVGPTPVAALGATDQHSQVQLYKEGPDDKFYTFLRVNRMRSDLRFPASPWDDPALDYLKGHSMFSLLDAEAEATRFALTEAGRPCLTVSLPQVNENAVGRLLMHLQMQTAAMGLLLYVNAFDQPGVEAGKRYAFGLMGRPGFEKESARIRKPAGKSFQVDG